jgi:hypothetical protein
MCWPVWNWGEGWGASGIGSSDRRGALRNSNGVVRSDLLERHGAGDNLHGYSDLEFGIVGSGRRSVSEVNDGTGQENPTSSLGACLARAMRCGSNMISFICIQFIQRLLIWYSRYSNGFQAIKKIKQMQDMQQ